MFFPFVFLSVLVFVLLRLLYTLEINIVRPTDVNKLSKIHKELENTFQDFRNY